MCVSVGGKEPYEPTGRRIRTCQPRTPLSMRFTPHGVILPGRLRSKRDFPMEHRRVSAGRRIGGYRCVRVTVSIIPRYRHTKRVQMRCGGSTIVNSVVCPGVTMRRREGVIRLYSTRKGPCTMMRFGRGWRVRLKGGRVLAMMGMISFKMCLKSSERGILLPGGRIPTKVRPNSPVRIFLCGSSSSHLVTAMGRPGLALKRDTVLGMTRINGFNTFLS